MLEIIRQAPAPAVCVIRGDDGSVEIERNIALSDWLPACVWTDDEWSSFGEHVLAAVDRGESGGTAPRDNVRWRAVADAHALLVWLALPSPAPASGSGHHGSKLADGYVTQSHLALAHSLIGLSFWHIDLAEQRIRANNWSWNTAGVGDTPEDGMPVQEIRSYIHPDDKERMKRAADDALAPGAGPIDAEARYRLPDGSYRTLLSRRVAERDALGTPVGVIGVSFDVTALREARHLTELAVEANRAKSQFLANMSHEIRTPMNGILGLARMLTKTELSAQQLGLVAKLERSARSLLGVLNDILDFSKIEAGHLDIERTEFRPGDVLEDLASLVGLQAEDKGLELMLDLPHDLPLVLGDPLRLGQVLINLGSNAVKFTAHGEVLVRVEQLGLSDSSVQLRFSVSDTGVGIDAASLQRLFEPFAQADASTTRRFGGTGLGLTISRRLVEMMGGRLEVDSVPGRGSTFSFALDFPLSATPSHLETAPREWHGVAGTNVLIVDDNATSRRILDGSLRTFGMKTAQAVDGPSAIVEALRAHRAQQPYDLLLLDWQMPGMDGVECLRVLTDSGLMQRSAVVMATAFGRDDVMRRLADAGLAVGEVLSKPVTPSMLFDACVAALGGPARAPMHAAAHQEIDAALRRALGGVRLLLVEDNAINREIALALLDEVDVDVAVAEDGLRALEMLSAHDFDGVLMDCQMPTMDGYEATRMIRREARWQDLPVIAMTANAMAGDRELALAAGMNDHVAKPIVPQDLYAKLALWFGRRR